MNPFNSNHQNYMRNTIAKRVIWRCNIIAPPPSHRITYHALEIVGGYHVRWEVLYASSIPLLAMAKCPCNTGGKHRIPCSEKCCAQTGILFGFPMAQVLEQTRPQDLVGAHREFWYYPFTWFLFGHMNLIKKTSCYNSIY